MAAKSKSEADLAVNGDETIARIQADIDRLEAELSQVIKEQPIGFSQRMVELIDQARAAGEKLAGAKHDQARQKEALAQMERLMAEYATQRRRSEAAGYLLHKALLLASSAFNLESAADGKAEVGQDQINTFLRQLDRENHDLYQLVGGRWRALDAELESELHLQARREEVLGTPMLPSFVSSTLGELHRLFKKAGGSAIDVRFYNPRK